MMDDDTRRRVTLDYVTNLQRNSPSTLAWHRTNDQRERFLADCIATRYPDAGADERAALVDSLRPAPPQPPPTPYEDPEFYRIMGNLADVMERTATDNGFLPAGFTRPFLATLDTGRIHAFSTVAPGSQEPVIFFDSHLFVSAMLLSMSVSRALPMDAARAAPAKNLTRADIVSRIVQDQSILARFQEAVISYAVTGVPTYAQPYVVEEEAGLFADSLCDSMLAFVLGHEYGHILAGHLNEEARKYTAFLNDADATVLSRDQELAADMMGVRLTLPQLDSASPLGMATHFWGADLFFRAIDIMERAVSLLATGSEGNRTLASHPPRNVRQAVARWTLVRTVGEELAEAAIDLSRLVDETLKLLWQATRGPFLLAHARGYRPYW